MTVDEDTVIVRLPLEELRHFAHHQLTPTRFV